jgi:signal transduction histidine kinase
VRLAPESPLKGAQRREQYPALILTVAAPLEAVHDTLQSLAAALAGLTLVVLVIALIAGRAVCRRALAPVAQMADAARAMGANDLRDRLPVAASADELADLGRAFNGLLDRLGEAFQREQRFAGEASHQLRTPLAALIGQVEVALRRNRDPSEYRRTLESVLAQAQRLRRVSEALLVLARSESDAGRLERVRTDLSAWIPEQLRPWDDHPRSADLTFEPFPGELPAEIHPDLFGELLGALIDNALKYSQTGTPVELRTGQDGEGTWVEVTDRGCGIDPSDMPHMFRPLFRAENARKLGVPGAGLGLAVAARIATALGGSIHVESAVGHGSRFRVRLPLVTAEPDPGRSAALPHSAAGLAPIIPANGIQSG